MNYRFSSRTAWDLGESDLARAIRLARGAGQTLIDLTVSNPTTCGFHYDAESILAPLSDPRALTYDPDPRGLLSAREAVAAYYGDHRAAVSPDAITLTTSTSEGYGYLFRLLCDAGDEILVPQPSYPLFDYLADLEDVRLRPYPLFYDYGWWIDFDQLERRIGPRTRAILLVHPNNPTGHATSHTERLRLEEICGRHGLALIVDEVFLDYPHTAEKLPSFAVGPHPALTFVLSGMSKIAGLPQMKVGWIAAFGPEVPLRQALARLEIVADTFLSMNTPAQVALPHWLQGRLGIQDQILERISSNTRKIMDCNLDLLKVDAGWSAIVRLPRLGMDAESILSAEHVITHPGAFYGIAERGRIIVSLITPEDEFSTGIERIAKVSN
ncbi:pyridoxal phosphate-dependent aminotransferase [Edaphobacter flagellatus]|uniref:pyridoxal phosphate-dependent aminotransferase n=1 Tax=Edaphobacter flagellatus TaxID=1933044 RepID=UPI0021B4207D|nr:pyridoxal phosphate-dependent aminotransferase [Edaphobacter flagellatus]